MTAADNAAPIAIATVASADERPAQPANALPLVSVIIRSIGRPTLAEALSSVARQTYPKIEVIVVNAIGPKHPAIERPTSLHSLSVVEAATPLPRSAAANAGLDAARGDYLIFLDDDDLLLPIHIETLVQALATKPEAKAAHTNAQVVAQDGRVLGTFDEPYEKSLLWSGNFLPIHAVMFARTLLESGCRFDESLDSYEDWDFWLQLSKHTHFLHCATATAIYRAELGQSGMARNAPELLSRQREARLMLWRKWWPQFSVEDYDAAIETLKHRQLTRVQTLDAKLAAMAQEREEMRTIVSQLDAQAATLREQIGQLESSLAEARRTAARLEQALDAMYQSTSWRVTAPLRALGRPLARLRALKSAWMQRHALEGKAPPSLFTLTVKSIRIFLREGPAGLLLRTQALEQQSRLPPALQARKQPSAADQWPPLHSVNFDRYSIIFVDVFDTAVLRPYVRPTDLLAYLGHRRGDATFAQRRIAREAATRAAFSSQKDILLSQIYAGLPDLNPEEEIALELKQCVANAQLLSCYQSWLAQGKAVYFVSDMYLDREVVASILERNGYVGYAGLFVSSDDQQIKGDGSRFAWLKAQIPGCESTAIHIGDHPIADHAQPRAHGFPTHPVPSAAAWFAADDFVGSKWEALCQAPSVGLSAILGLFRVWKCGFEETEPPAYWRQFGFLYGGALVTGFCNHIASELQCHTPTASRVYFLARDGDIISRVFSNLYRTPEAVYMLASRRCMSFPAIYALSPETDGDQLRLFTTPIGIETPDDVLERLAYDDLPALYDALEQFQRSGEPWSDVSLLRALQAQRHTLLEKADTERRMLLGYLESIGFFEQDDAIVVDVGWSGSIQTALQKIIDRERAARPTVHGLYLGVYADVPLKSRKSGYLFDGNPAAFAPYLNLIELLTASPQAGVVRISHDPMTGAYDAIRTPPTAEESRRQQVSAEIQQGILEFNNLAMRHFDGLLDFLRPDDFRRLFDALRTMPSQDDAQELDGLRHAMVLGNRFNQPVLTGV